MCKLWQCQPDDPRIINMDPIKKIWMFNNWIEDKNEQFELAKNHAYLMGWFWNPEAVQKLTGQDSERYVSTDEDFENAWQLVQNEKQEQMNIPEQIERKKRKRNRKLKDN